MQKTNLAHTQDLPEIFDSAAANAATIEPTGTFAVDPLLLLCVHDKRRPKLVSFKDNHSGLFRTFRIC